MKILTITILLAVFPTAALPPTPESLRSRDKLKPSNCETNAALLDSVKKRFLEKTVDSVVILIARLGSGEESREINRRRLFNVSHYLNNRLGLDANKIVIAEGERLKGYGRVEIYVSGVLSETLVAERRKDLCVTCCGAYEDFYPERIKHKKR